jgi:hypothetical protein
MLPHGNFLFVQPKQRYYVQAIFLFVLSLNIDKVLLLLCLIEENKGSLEEN